MSTTKLIDFPPKRRIGLSRSDYKLAPLLQSLNTSTTNPPAAAMASKPATKRQTDVSKESDEDIDRPPESCSDSEDNRDRSDLKETNYHAAASGTEEPATQGRLSSSKNGKAIGNGGAKNRAEGTRTGTRNVPSSSHSPAGSSSSTKRQGEEALPRLGAAMTNEMGFLSRPKKKPKKTYTNHQTRILVTKKKSKEKLTVPDPVEESPPKPDSSKRLKILPDLSSSPESTPTKASGLKLHAEISQTPIQNKHGSLNKYDLDLSDSEEDLAEQATRSMGLPTLHVSPAKPTESLKAYTLDLEDDLLSTAKSFLDQNPNELAPISQDIADYDFLSMTQRATCPMCGETVDPDDIRAYSKNGVMNIRTQEKFCRAHKTKNAQDDWEIKSYPTIDWDELDSRISKHHSFIEKLINGQNSHYRELWDANVTAGKDRNLRNMTSNLTPGYYGARGLRIFSENIMHKFTPLLKKRTPLDPLMSARGFAAYVQSVLVPEVAVRLIMEDMSLDVEEGRKILADSVDVGELLNEETGDVVKRKVDDSEGEDDSY